MNRFAQRLVDEVLTKVPRWHDVDLGAQQVSEVALQTGEREQARACRQVNEEVDVRVEAVGSTGNTVEYVHIADALDGGSLKDLLSVPS